MNRRLTPSGNPVASFVMSTDNIADNVTSAIARLDGVRQVLEFVKNMSVADARWVLAMAQQTLEGSSPAMSFAGSVSSEPPPPNGGAAVGTEHDLAELFEKMNPETDYDKILGVSFYLQQVAKQGDFDSLTITTQLRELGYKVSNITRAIDELTARTPALVMVTKKTGDTRQARRRYRLTQQGVRHVQLRLSETRD